MIRRIRERWHRKRIRKIYNQLDSLVRATYPLPAGLAAAVIGTCSKYRKTGITDVFLALDWLMREGKVIKDPGDGLLPDRYYERPGEERFEEWKKQVKKNTGADA